MLSMLIYPKKFNKIELLHHMAAAAAAVAVNDDTESDRCTCNVVNS